MTELNVPLLRKELEFLTTHPELHYQGVWIRKFACGTGGCLAGNTVLHLGWQPVWDADPDCRAANYIRHPDHSPRHARPVWAVAAEALGLNPVQRDALFAGGNTVRDMWQVAADISDGEIQAPLDLPQDPP